VGAGPSALALEQTTASASIRAKLLSMTPFHRSASSGWDPDDERASSATISCIRSPHDVATCTHMQINP
jgi:hypothetical protein